MAEWTCDDWVAIHDHMPGPGTRGLRVTGTCHAPTSGYSFDLRRRERQGANPKDLLLELDVEEPADVANPVMTDHPVEYFEETDVEYDTVSIVGVESGIPVDHPQRQRP